MLNITLEELVNACGGKYRGPDALLARHPGPLVTDNRQVAPNGIFAAVRGARVDGHRFVSAAMSAGAMCALAEELPEQAEIPCILVPDTLQAIYKMASAYRDSLTIPLIAVVGSVGKTSAKTMTADVLEQRFSVLRTPENRNNLLGMSLTLLSVEDTHQAAVLEVGIDHFGEMDETMSVLRPDTIIYTNIAPCHLEQLGDLDGVLRAKTEALAHMNPSGMLIVNGDDERLAALIPGSVSPNAEKVGKLTFGRGENCTVRAVDIGLDGGTVRCTVLQSGYAPLPVCVRGYGSHLVEAVLPAVAAARMLGMTDEQILKGTESYTPEENHSSVIRTGSLTIVSDCYNSSPKALESALVSLAALPGRRVAVLGSMLELGAQDEQSHRSAGIWAEREGLDLLVGIGSRADLLTAEAVRVPHAAFPGKEDFFRTVPTLLRRGDTVLVKASHGEHFEEIVEFLKTWNP